MTAPPISALAFSPDAATGAAPAVLAVRQLRLTDFRNYRQLRLDCGPEPVVLVGANGAGKTNLLEALSFLAPGRGLRRARLEEVCRRSRGEEPDAATWAVAATVDTPDGRLAIGTGLEPARTDGGLQRRAGRSAGGSRPRTAGAVNWPPAACAMPRPAPHPAGRIAAISRCATSISTCRRRRDRPASRKPFWYRSRWRTPVWWLCRAAVCRSCCSTRSQPISMQSAAPRCSTRAWRLACRAG